MKYTLLAVIAVGSVPPLAVKKTTGSLVSFTGTGIEPPIKMAMVPVVPLAVYEQYDWRFAREVTNEVVGNISPRKFPSVYKRVPCELDSAKFG